MTDTFDIAIRDVTPERAAGITASGGDTGHLPRAIKQLWKLLISTLGGRRHTSKDRVDYRAEVGHKRGLLLIWEGFQGKALQITNVLLRTSHVLRFDLYVRSVYLSPDERAIYVSLCDASVNFETKRHELKVFSTDTLEELRSPASLPARTDFKISNDGTVAFAENREVRALDSGKLVATLDSFGILWRNPAGGDPFVGFDSGTWSLSSFSSDGREHKLLTCKEAPTCAQISADGRIQALVYASHGGTLAIIISGFQQRRFTIDSYFGDAVSAELSPTGEWLAFAINHFGHVGLRSGHCVAVLNTLNGVLTKSEAVGDFIADVKVVPGQDCVVVGFDGGGIQRRSLRTLEVQWQAKPHSGDIRKLAFAPMANVLASLGGDNRLVLSDLTSGTVLTAKPFGFSPVDMQLRSSVSSII